MRASVAVCAAACGLAGLAATPVDAVRVLDAFEDVSGWRATPSDGVRLAIGQAPGFAGRSMRLEFDFQGKGGYAVARKAFALPLPANYEFRFQIRGEGPANNLEFKLVDPTGDNVWWVNRRGFEPPRDWQEIRIKKRHVEFAWGPSGGGDMARVAAIEIAITAGNGGKGWIALDELTLRELPPAGPYSRTPAATASSALRDAQAGLAIDGDAGTAWRAEGSPAWVAFDFLESREFGGLSIDWDADFARRYTVELSDDGQAWRPVRTVSGGDGQRDHLMLPEAEARHVRLKLAEPARGRGFGIREVAVRPLAFGASGNAFFQAIAREAPRGSFPRSFSGEQVYWTLVGTDGDAEEALLSEDGALEIRKGGLSIEPFLYENETLTTWSAVSSAQTLAGGYLPIPSVAWRGDRVSLEVTAFAQAGPGDASTLYARYRARNETSAPKQVRLFLALRPFQVNPPSQFLNTPGGVSRVETLSWDGQQVTINGKETIAPVDGTPAFGAVALDGGDLVDFLRRGVVPDRSAAADPEGFASGVLAYDLDLAGGEAKTVSLRIPFRPAAGGSRLATTRESPPNSAGDLVVPRTPWPATLEQRLAATVKDWTAKLGTVTFRLPEEAAPLVATLQSNLAYILINRDGPAIQPGSRAYERSWIRDGALTSSALLRLGHERPVRDFIRWYAPRQFENGKVPCCVDSRGADPVPENDSHGELIYLIAEHHRFAGDREFLAGVWPYVERAADYIETLRQQRRGAEYRMPDKLHFFGLLPESISHEGYSAKPMHSYWDDFWALRGLKDAVKLAEALGKPELAARYAARRDEFRRELHASIARTMARHGIDYIPGAAELGDFDATSTTIAISPGGELGALPSRDVQRTFEKYFEEFQRRRDGQLAWEGYTPYELRNVGVFVRLGWKERAHELLDFFMKDRRPGGWNGWPEGVTRELRKPNFLGDLPHTWVGSDFIRSFLDLFAYLREADRALVLAAGIPDAWVRTGDGIAIEGLRTEYGALSYSLAAEGRGARLRVRAEGLRLPPGGIVLRWAGRETPIRRLPADVVVP